VPQDMKANNGAEAKRGVTGINTRARRLLLSACEGNGNGVAKRLKFVREKECECQACAFFFFFLFVPSLSALEFSALGTFLTLILTLCCFPRFISSRPERQGPSPDRCRRERMVLS
jgi:hypothetical protein